MLFKFYTCLCVFQVSTNQQLTNIFKNEIEENSNIPYL